MSKAYELEEPGSVEHHVTIWYIKQEDSNLYEHFKKCMRNKLSQLKCNEAALETIGFTNIVSEG